MNGPTDWSVTPHRHHRGMFEHDAKLTRWFAANGGIVDVRSAASIGVDVDAVLRRHAAGLLVREHHGVYRDAGRPASFDTDLRAALAAAGDDAYVSGHSLMRLYDVRGAWSATPEITVLGDRHLDLPGVKVRRLDRIEDRDLRRRHGLLGLAPPLGLLTLGASAPRHKVEVATHDMVFQRHTAVPQLIDALKRYEGKGRWGVASYRHSIRSLDDEGRATQTNMELDALRVLRQAGLPEPRLQLPVVDGDGRRRKLDIAWPDQLLDLETDGDRWHTSTRDRRAMEVRDAALRAIGYEVVRVDSDDVAHHLDALVPRLRSFFGS